MRHLNINNNKCNEHDDIYNGKQSTGSGTDMGRETMEIKCQGMQRECDNENEKE